MEKPYYGTYPPNADALATARRELVDSISPNDIVCLRAIAWALIAIAERMNIPNDD